jgi:hypothetical protein
VWLAELRPEVVPSTVSSLLPLARKWGISDDGYRSEAIDKADADTLAAIVTAIDATDSAALEHWLTGPEADAAPSDEYVAMTCLLMARDEAMLRLE